LRNGSDITLNMLNTEYEVYTYHANSETLASEFHAYSFLSTASKLFNALRKNK